MKEAESSINNLTDNEDFRQELWVFYLKNNDIDGLSDYLASIKKKESRYLDIIKFINLLFKSKDTKDFHMIWDTMTDVERNIIFMLAVGYDIPAISEHTGIDEVKIKNAINVILKNKGWDTP